MKKLLIAALLTLGLANNAFAATCESVTAGIESTKSTLIAHASNIIVSDTVLSGARADLNNYMLDLSEVADASCDVADLSGKIAQGMQAVENLASRNEVAQASL